MGYFVFKEWYTVYLFISFQGHKIISVFEYHCKGWRCVIKSSYERNADYDGQRRAY